MSSPVHRPQRELFPLFLKLDGRRVLVVGGGAVAAAKVDALRQTGAAIAVVAPEVTKELGALAEAGKISIARRCYEESDLEGVWLVVAAATPEVNRIVAATAGPRRLYVLAVDDKSAASAYGAGVLRRGGVTVAVSTDGRAPALAGLVREGLEAVLPEDLEDWSAAAARARASWKAAGVPMKERRPLLLEALNELYAARSPALSAEDAATAPASAEGAAAASAEGAATASAEGAATAPAEGAATAPAEGAATAPAEGAAAAPLRNGRVTLVGAGPGTADLITVRGMRRLAEADLVLYDALASEQMRGYAPRARWFFVGKRACRQSIDQESVNRLLVKHARRGRHVVRLKSGDPFVFGRGGEEALALARAGIPFEIVPGVSSAVAGPGLAGIPVTHRGLASSFAVLTGHHEEVYAPLLDGFAPRSLTLVVLMGLGQRARIAERLTARGWSADTPAAVIVGAATPESWTWTGTLAGLGAAEPPAASAGAPGLLVIGAVVAVAGELAIGLAAAAAAAAR
jgi:uroporphyrin-III C-methyltransferase/precorrin-2 dehydrogenase/sirohydrochlorin ferrochelatase